VPALSRDETARLIARRDRAFRPVIASVGPPPAPRPAPVDQRFASLVRSVTYQLLATRAAATIHARVVEVCDGEVTPDAVLGAGVARLRGAGLSTTKAEALRDLAAATHDGSVRLASHGRWSDDEVLADVVKVRGVGPWTAHMYLMFTLARRDVWPVGDFGVRHGWSLLHGLDETIRERDLAPVGDAFAGSRSAVAWYCWQAVHLARGH
jgi:DNA-3-methyladenine glycosylase II